MAHPPERLRVTPAELYCAPGPALIGLADREGIGARAPLLVGRGEEGQ